MQAIVHQLGELFLQAVPTVLIILLFYFILRAVFFKPLLAVMAERDSRTVGAQKAAEAAQAAAAQRVKQVYAEQEAARKKLLDERSAQIKNARTQAAGEVSAAKARVAAELAAARRDIETGVAQLSAEIARRILQAPPRPGAPASEAR